MDKHKRKQTQHLGHPAFVTGIVTFEFFNNDDDQYRDKALRDLAKAVCREFHISAVPIFPEANPEGGELALAAVGINQLAVEKIAAQVMKYLEEKSPGRIIADRWLAEEIPSE